MDEFFGKLFDTKTMYRIPNVIQVVGFKSKNFVYVRRVPVTNIQYSFNGNSCEIDWKWLNDNEIKEPVRNNKSKKWDVAKIKSVVSKYHTIYNSHLELKETAGQEVFSLVRENEANKLYWFNF